MEHPFCFWHVLGIQRWRKHCLNSKITWRLWEDEHGNTQSSEKIWGSYAHGTLETKGGSQCKSPAVIFMHPETNGISLVRCKCCVGIHSRNVPSGAYGLLSGIALAPAHWFPVTSTHQIKSKYPSIAKSMHCVGCEPLPQLTDNKHLPAVKLLRSLWEAHRSRMARSKQLEALEIECKFGTDDFGWWLITLAKHKHCIL